MRISIIITTRSIVKIKNKMICGGELKKKKKNGRKQDSKK